VAQNNGISNLDAVEEARRQAVRDLKPGANHYGLPDLKKTLKRASKREELGRFAPSDLQFLLRRELPLRIAVLKEYGKSCSTAIRAIPRSQPDSQPEFS
jgi:hypothetical protein